MIYTGAFKNVNMITWVINEICNFNCSYCNNPERGKHISKCKILEIDIDKLKQGLNFLQKDWLFHITGGEPFLEKNIIEIFKTITENHYISLNTNLSTKNNLEFANEIDSTRCLFINAAVHITEREKSDTNFVDYIKKINYLQKKDFNIIAYYVADPLLFNRIESDIEFLKSEGVKKVRIKIFRGILNGKCYPASFNPKERSFLESLEADYPEFEILNKSFKFYNRKCLAGQRFYVMDRSGDLKRCSATSKSYGNLFRNTVKHDMSAKPCPKKECSCPYEGIRNVVSGRGPYIVALTDRIFERCLRYIKSKTKSK